MIEIEGIKLYCAEEIKSTKFDDDSSLQRKTDLSITIDDLKEAQNGR